MAWRRPPALHWRRHISVLALLLVAAGASAHDTWFASHGQRSPGALLLALGTGDAFPVFDSPIGPAHLQRRGCRESGKNLPLEPVAQAPRSLILRAQTSGTAALSCWAQLIPSQIALDAKVVAVYFAEAQPPASVRAAWAAMEARGVVWQERYTKHARIVVSAAAPGDAQAADARPDDMGMGIDMANDMAMDMVLVGQVGLIRAADTVTVQVLRDGRPLPDLAVELRHVADGRATSTGAWHRTDARGRVRVLVGQAGKWLLRGIDIRPSADRPDSWDTRFATLVFDAAAAP